MFWGRGEHGMDMGVREDTYDDKNNEDGDKGDHI